MDANTIATLPPECWYKILKRLTVAEQYKLLKTCRHFRDLIESTWRRTFKTFAVIDYVSNTRKNLSLNIYYAIMKTIQPTLTQLTLFDATMRRLDVMCEMVFPQLHTLEAHFSVNQKYCRYSDQNTRLLATIFPATRNLTLVTVFSGKFLWQFTALDSLNVNACCEMRSRHLTRTFETLQLRKYFGMHYGNYNSDNVNELVGLSRCHTLQMISVDDMLLLPFAESVLAMPNLNRLDCFCETSMDELMTVIIKEIGERVASLYFNDVHLSNARFTIVRNLPNIQKLVLHFDTVQLHAGDYIALAKALPTLREVHVVNSYVADEYQLAELLKYCPQLRLLNVARSINITRMLLCHVRDQLQQTRPMCDEPFRLYCTRTDITDTDIANLQVSPHLLVVDGQTELELSIPPMLCIGCSWTPKSCPMGPPEDPFPHGSMPTADNY